MKNTLAAGKYKIASESSENRTYTLTIVRRGRGVSASCSCPGFRRHNHCKHATAAKNGEYNS